VNWSEQFGADDLSLLGSALDVERKSKALALMDAVLIPDWEERYFLFNCHWDDERGDRLGSMRNGHGDEYFVLFTADGAVGKVHCDDSSLADVSGPLSEVPDIFLPFKNEPAFSITTASFFFWNQTGSATWKAAPHVRGKYPWLGFLVNGFSAYHEWAEAYLERTIDPGAVEEIFRTLKIDKSLLRRLNPDRKMSNLAADIEEIGASSV
jgi:hypothetical protein